ncbi:Fructose-1,6-bisphosphatase class 1 [Hartmannibacter diazotrophicus]|uniref:Fructose-1,6-bisphosphatase class 1 n=1 Tax=Hartmannibacter diazotrophicus TaxID=1482074 RepID=A0A2C9D010_9HYPH|nr:class 1 fructose-bisphosphatase [Hartmannibacter diazotrophicus]SON53586.1 Fructose-1,6-bisphosphatase class 1 [Hartmannibacter diazotrophicus]
MTMTAEPATSTAAAAPLLTLEEQLGAWPAGDADRQAVKALLLALAEAGKQVRGRLAEGALHGDPARIVGINSDGDKQKALDVEAHGIFVEASHKGGAAVIGSEEAEEPIAGDPNGRVAVAFDPIDGSSHIGIAGACGTLFSVLSLAADGEHFQQPGSAQLAAGYLVYGPETVFCYTLGAGVFMLTLDPVDGVFKGRQTPVVLPAKTAEIGVDLSFRRHWHERPTAYVDDCLLGKDGSRGADVRLRWMMAAVVDLHRILKQGGIFVLPADKRPENRVGRLRHVYEVNPMALLIEQAGGLATDGVGGRLLDRVPEGLHARAPIVAGSREEVERYLSF